VATVLGKSAGELWHVQVSHVFANEYVLVCAEGNAALPTAGRESQPRDSASLKTSGRCRTRTCDIYLVRVAL
jgi:hypothetical protein